MEIKVMARQGHSIRSIARELGLSRQVVRKHLLGPGTMVYKSRSPRATKLDGVAPYLLERIEAAKPQSIPASVLFLEAVARGYDGCESQLRRWVALHKPVTKSDPVVRFETAPGEQMQADFTFIRKGARPLLALVATLGHSRASFVRFVGSEDTDSLMECLKLAFEFFGGVPQHVLFDNAKSVILQRDCYGYGLHQWNPKLLDLSCAYGFTPRVCRPYRARTKGKVERFNLYLKRSFVVPLSVSLRQAGLELDCATANAHVGPWLTQVANARLHGTTGKRPDEQLVLERATLLRLPVMVGSSALPAVAPCFAVLPIESLQHPLSVYEQLIPELV
jgi:transposase